MWLQIAPVFLFGMLTGYIDIDSFFREKRISYIVTGNFRFWGFVVLNGAISAVFLFWSLSTPPDSLINKSIQLQNPWAKMFIIGFAVPLLVRSKLFSFGEDQTAAGPALAYDWLRRKTFISVHVKSGAKKEQITGKYAARLAGRAAIDTQIKDWVDDYVRPFATSAQQAELDAEFTRIQGRYTGAAALSQDHVAKLIRWAMDSAAISYIEEKLARA
jgi:hypothetical protein